MDFIQVSAIVGGVAAIISIGVSIGVYITKIPAMQQKQEETEVRMQKQIDDLRDDARKDRERTFAKFEKHDEAIGEVEKSIVGIEHNVKTLLESSRANGMKLDRLFGLLSDRPPN